MTYRSAIFSSALLFCELLSARMFAADVSGVISLESKGSLLNSADRSAVVVWLEPIGQPADSPAPLRERILQRNKTFTPHVLVIPVGSTVDFPNLDWIYHNAFSNFNGQIFDVSLYPPGTSRSVTFRRAGVVRVFCNIHPAMSAVIVVLDTPFYALTDRSGRYTLSNVPPGTYKRMFFHERATSETLRTLVSNVDVPASGGVLPPVTISETGYIPLTHMNKYGRPYPKNAGDNGYSIPQ